MDQTPSGDDLRPPDAPQEPPDSRKQIDWDDLDDDDLGVTPQAGSEPPLPSERPVMFEPYSEPPDDTFDDDVWDHPVYAAPVEPPRRRAGGIVTGFILVILALGLVAATLFAVQQYRQKALVENAALQALGLISAGAPPDLAKKMGEIQTSLTSGHPDQAAQELYKLRLVVAGKTNPEQPGAAGTEPIPAEAYRDLPPDAQKFFHGHEDLFRKFLIMCTQARQLKEKGQNVDALRAVRDQVIEAARLGQQPEVEKKMTQMMGMLGGPGGPGGDRGPLAKKADRLKAAMERAQSQGRDVRAAFPLMQQAEQAAQAGKLDDAGKFIDQALEVVRRAPRAPRGGPRGRGDSGYGSMPGRPRVPNLAPFVRALLGVMAAEEQNLRVVSDELLQMRQLILGSKPEAPTEPATFQPMVDKALGELKTMSDRRQELTRQMKGPGTPGNGRVRPGPGGPGRDQALTPEERRGIFQILLGRLSPILDRLRGLSDTDYQTQKNSLIAEIVKAVLAPPEKPVAPPTGPTLSADPEQRVRQKMMSASLVLKQWELQGKDTSAVEDLFTEARKALYAKKFDDAEKLVDQARKLLGMDAAVTPPPPPPTSSAAPKAGSKDDPTKIDLRAR